MNKEDWREVRLTKKDNTAQHVRMKREDCSIVTSAEMPDILADYFEKRQWGKEISAEERERFKREKHYRTNMLFEEKTRIETGDYRFDELERVLKKSEKKKRQDQTK